MTTGLPLASVTVTGEAAGPVGAGDDWATVASGATASAAVAARVTASRRERDVDIGTSG